MNALRKLKPGDPATGRIRSFGALLLVATTLLLAGCLAEEGVGGGGGTPAGWNDVAAILWNPGGCGGCHPPSGSGPGVTILDYASLINDNTGTCTTNTAMITLTDRTQSCLYLAVTGQEGNNMSSFLTPSQAETIGQWIDDGAPYP